VTEVACALPPEGAEVEAIYLARPTACEALTTCRNVQTSRPPVVAAFGLSATQIYGCSLGFSPSRYTVLEENMNTRSLPASLYGNVTAIVGL
jgi:hypothetical protein